MSREGEPSPKVRPAQLSFLAIYNPSLGSEEDEKLQILYFTSKTVQQRHFPRSHEDEGSSTKEEVENERLRQVGLAQGMVDFAKNFSNGKPVDSIDTQKSRIVLQELEPEWWILASIDLTHVPAHRTTSSTAKSTSSVEYSSREVSPPELLIAQLLQAHAIFLLQHSTSLEELYSRLARQVFCDHLDRFWTNFTDNWDVLLHGNPAVDVYNAVKLASGGELGMGVGEEEWGSGEREVLEDFIQRTEGLVDLVVSRFGDAPTAEDNPDDRKTPSNSQPRAPVWLGTDTECQASDGVIFSGGGAISRPSLAAISQWMENIYKCGEGAYGVGESASSRSRRKRRKIFHKHARSKDPATQITGEARRKGYPSRDSSADLRRKAAENNTSTPGIPPPLVSSIERSLAEATAKASSPKDSHGFKGERVNKSTTLTEETSLFDKDKMIKYLSLGYGSAWTLSPKGFARSRSQDPPDEPSAIPSNVDDTKMGNKGESGDDEAVDPPLQEVEPTPEVSDHEDQPYVQPLEESIGKFIIGFTGDLETTELTDDGDGGSEPAEITAERTPKQRIFLRTLHVQVPLTAEDNPLPGTSKPSKSSTARSKGSSTCLDTYHRMFQVVVYVHQPFIFLFLFDLHTYSLSLPSFYRSIHNQLGPLQRSLLRSTDPTKVADRIAAAIGQHTSTTVPGPHTSDVGSVIYDLVFDPSRLTVRTNIPAIPLPGSLAAEGFTAPSKSVITVSGSWYTLGIPISSSHPTTLSSSNPPTGLVQSPWTRAEALGVHTQLLSTWSATRPGASHARERERTVRTTRGWWVLWTRIVPRGPAHANHDDNDTAAAVEAFLVRRASDQSRRARDAKASTRSSGWLLREQNRDVSGSSTGSAAPAGMAGVRDGVGVDARKWVEGLVSLNR